MTFQFNLSKWAQAVLVSIIGAALLGGKLDVNLPAGLAATPPAEQRAERPPTPADGWTAPATTWVAPTAPGQ